MKKFISVILTFCMLLTMFGAMSVSAAANDGVLDFDTGAQPTFTITGEGTANEQNVYEEDGYKIQGRKSYYGHEWKIEKDVFGKPGYSIYGGGVTDAEASETQTDPCLIAFADFTNPAMLTSSDQYYVLEFDVAFNGGNTVEFNATADNGKMVTFMGGGGANRNIKSDFFRNNNGLYPAYNNMWHNFKFVVKSADITATDNDAADATAENNHQYWIYANGNLVASGTTALKIRSSEDNLTSFAGFKGLQLRYYDVKTSGSSLRLDNICTYVTDALPKGWEGSIDFDSLTESTDIAAINNQLWASETGYFVPGENQTFIRGTTQALASVEGGVYGKAADDMAISVSHGGTSTDGTHFMQIVQAGKGFTGMHRIEKGEFFEYQMSMGWEPDAVIIGAQGFYDFDNPEGIRDGKGHMLISVSPTSGAVNALGVNVPGVKLTSQTWYKFNLVVHSGDVNAANDEDKNWFNLYVNDTLVGEKIVFTPSVRATAGNVVAYPTFMGVDQVWLQNGYGANAEKKSGKVYYDDIMFKNGLSQQTYSPVTVSTTDEIAAGYIGAEGHVPGMGSYVDNRVSFDADKWSVTDGTITFVPSGSNNFARIIRADGTKIYDTFKVDTKVSDSKTFDATSAPSSVFNYAAKDFTTYTFGSGIAGRSADDYSFKMESTGVYDNWVMTIDEEGNATSADYQNDPANWINKSDIPADTKATYKFRDSYNPFVQMFPANHFPNLNYTAPWSANLSLLADGDYNTVDLQVVSTDDSGKVTMALLTLNNSNGFIYVNKVGTGISYREGEWLNFVVNVYPATKQLTLWYNGEIIWEGEFDFPWEHFARIKIQHAIGHDGYHSIAARTCKLYADDIIFYQGSRFVPAAITATANSDKFDSTFIEADVIIANAATTTDDIASAITGGTTTVYSDNSFAAEAAGNAAKGNIAVVKSADGFVYKYIYIANSDDASPVTASMAYTQSYQLGHNSYAPKYNVDNVVDGTIIVASYQTVDDVKMFENCDFADLEGATYEYNGKNLVVTPAKRVNITTTEETSEVKLFFWDSINGLKPIAPVSVCNFKAAN